MTACVAVLVVRLAGLYPEDQQHWQWLLVLPALAALGAWLFHRRVTESSAARAIDVHAKTDDLFLTMATLPSSAGEYQPLVEQAAGKFAARVVPADVVPFQPQRRMGVQAVVCGALALLIWLVPTLDPLGRVEAATRVDKQKKEVESVRKVIAARNEQLQKEVKAADERSEKITQQMKELMASLRQMKPTERKPNSQTLQSHRQSLNEQWQSLSNEDLREMLSENIPDQQLGGARGQKHNEWLRELQQGRTDGLQKQLDQAAETLQAMMEAKTPEDRQKLASRLRKELQDLKKFSSQKAGSPELDNALNQALKSLEAMAARQPQEGESMDAGEQEMAAEAARALQEALQLSKQELEQVAQAASDMQKLEEALKAMQMAENLNQEGQLDGEQMEGMNSLEEYARKYREMMNGRGQDGEADRDQPGAIMDEDDTDPEGYKTEKSKSQIQAGKVLLSIKTREAATEKDFDEKDLETYERTVTEIRQGVQAAIENEQIPPGYVDGIKSYFDNLESKPSSASDTAPATDSPAPTGGN
jgi:tetratricopeptide (TPR) repeat protein